MSDLQDKVKNSITLPVTNFPMKANLPVKEAYITKFWDKIDIFPEFDSQKEKSRKKGVNCYTKLFCSGL